MGGGTFRTTLGNNAGDLTQKEHILLDNLISKFRKHIAKQYKLLESGRPNKYPTILKSDRHPPREEQMRVLVKMLLNLQTLPSLNPPIRMLYMW